MLLHNDNHFYIGSVSFSLPNNVYLVTAPEIGYEYGVQLVAFDRDRSYNIMILGEYSEISAKDFFDKKLKETCFHWFGGVTPISCNDLNGYYLLYTGEYDFCEYRFDLADGNKEINTLCIIIDTNKKHLDIQTIIQYSAVKELLNSIQPTYTHL